MNCPTCDSNQATDFHNIQCCTCDHYYNVCKKCWDRKLETYRWDYNKITFKFLTKCPHCQSEVCHTCCSGYTYKQPQPQKCRCGVYNCEMAYPGSYGYCDACTELRGNWKHIVKRIYDTPCAYIYCNYIVQRSICCMCYIKGKEVKDILTNTYLDPGKIIYEYWGTDYGDEYKEKEDGIYCDKRCSAHAAKLKKKAAWK
jgi:hypothetical protein